MHKPGHGLELVRRLNGVRPRRPEQWIGAKAAETARKGLNGVRPRRPEQSPLRGICVVRPQIVSMESGLEGRNNLSDGTVVEAEPVVSMESGLEGRNNTDVPQPRWMEKIVSMESGLEGRNNVTSRGGSPEKPNRLNGVRPRRPEQCTPSPTGGTPSAGASQWRPA